MVLTMVKILRPLFLEEITKKVSHLFKDKKSSKKRIIIFQTMKKMVVM